MKWFAAFLMTVTALAQAPEPPTNFTLQATTQETALQISAMAWHAPAGWQTNGISFNVREYQPGQLITCQFCWALVTNVSTTNVTIICDPLRFRGITATNRFTGVEENIGLSPVHAVFSRL